MTWIKDKHPLAHSQYLVKRDGKFFTAIPCYGMHSPLWVVQLMKTEYPTEAEPVSMLDTDEWFNLTEFDRLKKRSRFLSDLEDAGVDNWNGYFYAQEAREERNEI